MIAERAASTSIASPNVSELSSVGTAAKSAAQSSVLLAPNRVPITASTASAQQNAGSHANLASSSANGSAVIINVATCVENCVTVPAVTSRVINFSSATTLVSGCVERNVLTSAESAIKTKSRKYSSEVKVTYLNFFRLLCSI